MSPILKRLLGAAGLVVLLGGVVGAWALGLFTPEPDEVSLADAVAIETQSRDEAAAAEAASTTSAPTTTAAVSATDVPETTEPLATPTSSADVVETTAQPTTTSVPDTTTAGPMELEGTWQVVPGEATFVGYRARGQTGVGVGRSPAVTGTLTAEADLITSVEIVADLTQLKSDSSLRDDHLGDDGLETRTFPTSTFTLVEPISVPVEPAEGVEAAFAATGDLTVRDVTNRETIDLQATMVGGRLVVVGSLGVALDDYGAAIGGTDRATMEFSLVFTKSP